MMKIYTVLLLSMCAALSSCRSKAVLTSSDPEATIQIADAQGKGTLTYSDSAPIWSSTKVLVKKDNCKTLEYSINRSDEISRTMALLAIPSYGATLPWVGGYRADYHLRFECLPEAKP